MPFKLITALPGEVQNARFDESLIATAAQEGPVASLWEAPQGLVVPRTYRRHECFDAVCARFAEQAWPITVRLSGGGVVPQGPGIINLSLAYAVEGPPLQHSDEAYRLICTLIQNALKPWEIETRIQAVEGSFCDGRYNLACGPENSAKKVVGTAQLWRRINLEHATVQVVLVHALLLAAVDARILTDRANQLEQQLGSDKRYDVARIASLYECLPGLPAMTLVDFVRGLKKSLSEQIEAIV
ncbi:lipoyl protein ligase domain-containing protein [Paralcaligenes ureilyticus]|uniref:Lipoate-protein ligase A n=1 Tax=Paralcaligenes ureilyticus TaxID=627131 RepID=A0A4R3MA32_9BURK|nr:lipoate--protein ligase family protein [Paralcaligenes ureilyticus]TCT08667.1 lipoate-protein ligase A [Paralcaligenes ureilyticus]